MNKNINIPITPDQPIVLTGSIPSGGGMELDIRYQTGGPNNDTVSATINTPKFELNFNNSAGIASNVFNKISCVISKFIFDVNFKRIEGTENESLSNFIGFNGTIIFKGIETIGGCGIYSYNDVEVYIPKTLTSIGTSGIFLRGANSKVYYEGTESEWNSITGVQNVNVRSIEYNVEIPNE